MSARGRLLTVACALVVAVLAVFSPALGAGFLDWDDDRNFVENHAYRGLSPAHLEWMATTRHMGHYQPLAWLSLALDHALWGMDARGYHATNVLLHALAAVAFLALARRLLGLCARPPPGERALDLAAGFAALLFALHPLRCESVAWVTERRDVLSGLLLILAVHAWLGYATSTGGARGRRYVLALLLFCASLLAKASGLVLPAVLLVLDGWPLGRTGRGRLRGLVLEKLPFLALSAVFAALAVWAARYESATFRPLAQHGVAARIVQAGYALSFYAGRTLWPLHLWPIHELPARLEPLAARWLGPALAGALVTLGLFLARGRLRAAWTAWLCYGIFLAPVSGLLQAGPQLVADRYGYLACLPFALLAGGALLVWIERRPAQREVALQLAAGVALVLSIATWRQTRIWRDGEALWTHTLACDPDNATAHLNLGVLRMRQGTQASERASRARLWSEALGLFERGHALSPQPEFLVDQGLVHMLLADLDPARSAELLARARELFERGLELQAGQGGVPPRWKLQHGILLLRLGDVAPAAVELADFVERYPDDPEGRRMLSVALSKLGRTAEALGHLERAVELEPGDASLWIRLGLTSKELGRLDEARAQLERAVELRRRELGAAASSDPDCLQALRELEQLAGR